MPPSSFNYKVKLNCIKHPPFPQAMCNSCLPDNCVVKRQEYRHVDYCQIMNSIEIKRFLEPWIKSGKSCQRIGFLYGYYAEDPNYKGGVRAILEAM